MRSLRQITNLSTVNLILYYNVHIWVPFSILIQSYLGFSLPLDPQEGNRLLFLFLYVHFLFACFEKSLYIPG